MYFNVLENLYNQMLKDKLTIGSLQTEFEQTNYGIIFSTDKEPWSILFIRPDNEEYSLNISRGFTFPKISNLKEFKWFFGIPEATVFSKSFAPFHVLNELDNHLKFRQTPNFYERSAECSARKIPESDRVYYLKTINHDQNKDGRNFTPENRRKVKELLPETFERIKDANISIGFTDWESAQFKNPTLESNAIDQQLKSFNL
ncbi:hypothetical protein AAFB08_002628 [Enterococcus faecalis]